MLHNQPVAVKIQSILILLLLLTLTVGIVGFYAAAKIAGMSEEMYQERLQPIQVMDEVRLLSKDTESRLLQLTQTGDKAKQQNIIQQIDENTKNINVLQEKFETTTLEPVEKQNWEELQKNLSEYRQVRSDIIKLAKNGQQQEAFAMYTAKQQIFEKTLVPRKNISDFNVNKAKNLYQESAEMAKIARNAILATTVMAILLAIVLGILLTRAISRPLKKIVETVQEIAGGDFSERPRRVISRDEIGQLADAVVLMRTDLRKLVINMLQSSEHVAAAATELNATAEQCAEASDQTAHAVTDVAAGTERQVQSLTKTAEVVESLSAGVEQSAAGAGEVAVLVEKTTVVAADGLEAVDKAVSQMGNIEKAVTDSAEIVMQLGENSRDIGQIVETIANIAGQTNLLALNAAIEAARAGEQGRGFAVVAEEVRKLAEQSEDATRKITTIIEETRQGTEKAVAAMENGSREVKLGTTVVGTAGQAFQEIATAIQKISGQIREISMAMQHMAENSEHIVSEMQQLDQVSKDSSFQAQNISAATEQQSASIEEISNASRGLMDLATELQTIAGKFKI